jgi:hypothetical protein
MAQLPTAAQQAIEEAVRAVVGHDHERLRVIAAEGGDLYVWTRQYGSHGTVDLVMPPGSVDEWPLDICDVNDGSKHVIVDMWTDQEGRSDLSLELELRETAAGVWATRVLDLHVL